MSDVRTDRNNIFNDDEFSNPLSAASNMRGMMGTETQTEIIPLPSNGKVYSQESSLFERETVEIRHMTAREEDILTSRTLAKKGTVITELIKSCLIDKSISVPELISGDRNALMISIRITGYGQEYNVDMTCPACQAKFKHAFDLSQLPIKSLEVDPVKPGTNEFLFELPMSKKKVTFKFLTGRDEEEMNNASERMKKISTIDNLVTSRLQYSILSVDGDYNKQNISNFIRSMKAGDSLAFRRFVDAIEPGIEMKQEMRCDSCGHEEEVNIPLGVSFFWPDT